MSKTRNDRKARRRAIANGEVEPSRRQIWSEVGSDGQYVSTHVSIGQYTKAVDKVNRKV